MGRNRSAERSAGSSAGGSPGRSLGVGGRLGCVFAVVALAFTAAVGVAIAGVRQGQAIDRSLRTIEEVQRRLQTVHYYDADVCGWESFILLDAYNDGAVAALSEDSENYAGLQDSRAALGKAVAAVDTGALSAGERAAFTSLQQTWTAYWAADETFIGLIRHGTPADLKAASEQLRGPSADLYQQLIDTNTRLSASVVERARVAHVEADGAARSAMVTSLTAGAIAVVVGTLLLVLVTRGITGPLRACRDVLHALAARDLTAEIRVAARGGEVADIASAVTVLRDMLRTQVRSIQEVAEDLTGQSQSLTASSQDAQQVATALAAGTSTAARRAAEVAATVGSVATSGQEMHAGIQAISGNAREGADVATEAVRTVADGEEAIVGLVDAAEKIETVVGFITTIAEQTNLLALNATIEAARAGQAGQGFAVVANEVKDLAQETARATGEIADRVTALHAGSRGASAALSSIETVMDRINRLQVGIAASVAQEATTADELSRGIDTAAAGVGTIADGLEQLATEAGTSARAAAAAREAAGALVADAAWLTEIVSGFRTS